MYNWEMGNGETWIGGDVSDVCSSVLYVAEFFLGFDDYLEETSIDSWPEESRTRYT